MARNCDNEKWVHSNSIEHEEEEEEDQEEALSLCDLPTSEDNSRKEPAAQATKPQDQDFDFGSWAAAEMCAADDVFFKGRILPLRHSISSESGLTKLRAHSANISQGIARCASMDHCTSSGFITNASSSRSSSVRSHNSASSGSTSTTTTLLPPKGYKPKIRNQFHSHPSPSPQLRIPSNRQGNTAHPNRKSSTMWRFFQVGLLRTPEIELMDLKIRSKNNTVHAFGSRNSSTSTSTSSSVSNVESKKGANISVTNGKKMEKFYKIENLKKKKVHSGRLFGSGCKCSVETVPLNNFVIVKNSNEGDQTKEGLLGKKKKKMKNSDQNHGKQAMSRHRTFEWLKQLSLQEGAASVADEV